VEVLNAGQMLRLWGGHFDCGVDDDYGLDVSNAGRRFDYGVDVSTMGWTLRLWVDRECHGFVNPCGLVPRVPAGAGTGWEFVTLAQPVPVTWV